MNTHTTHTAREMARPSRLRVLRARVIAWHDEHRNGLALALVSAVAVTLSAFFAVANIADGAPVGSSWFGAFGSLAVAFIVGTLAYFIGDEAGAARAHDNGANLARVITRDMGDEVARLTRERDDLAAALTATQVDARVAQEEARHYRAELARYASALVDMALDDDGNALTLTVSAPSHSYYLEAHTVTACVNGVRVALGTASDGKHETKDEARRVATLDAIDKAATELAHAAYALAHGDDARAAGLVPNSELVRVLRERGY